MTMITTATSLILLPLLFAVFTADGRTNIHRILELNDYGEGICQLAVLTQGYSCEEHKVITEDGYILNLQRIPMGRSGGGKTKGAKQPVLLQHGLLSDAKTWVAGSTNESLGFILADNDYDVWLANMRGTNYSSGHLWLSSKDPEYWNWTWDELVGYDIPAMFEYIYNQTGQKLYYVGHSVGTLMGLGAFSRHEVLTMLRSVALLSPIAYLGHFPSPLLRAAAETFLPQAAYWLGLKEFIPGGTPATKLLDDICDKIDCSSYEDVITGPNCCLSHSSHFNHLQPTSTKTLIHLSQMVRTGTIKMYNYGNDYDNNKYYGQATPPPYIMSNIPDDLPLLIGYGGKDLLSDVKDVHTLIRTLSDHDPDKLVLLYVEEYAHLDFVYGLNAKEVVYNPIMAFFKKN